MCGKRFFFQCDSYSRWYGDIVASRRQMLQDWSGLIQIIHADDCQNIHIHARISCERCDESNARAIVSESENKVRETKFRCVSMRQRTSVRATKTQYSPLCLFGCALACVSVRRSRALRIFARMCVCVCVVFGIGELTADGK